MSVHRRVDQENMIHIHNTILLSNKEERNHAICKKVGELEDK